MHQLRIERDGYATHWVCTCGWTTPMRDPRGHYIPDSNLAAIRHATTHTGEDSDG